VFRVRFKSQMGRLLAVLGFTSVDEQNILWQQGAVILRVVLVDRTDSADIL